MDDVEVVGRQEMTERHHPAEVEVVGCSEPVHGDSKGFDRRDEGVLRVEDVGDLVVECRAIPSGHEVDEQSLSASVT